MLLFVSLKYKGRLSNETEDGGRGSLRRKEVGRKGRESEKPRELECAFQVICNVGSISLVTVFPQPPQLCGHRARLGEEVGLIRLRSFPSDTAGKEKEVEDMWDKASTDHGD